MVTCGFRHRVAAEVASLGLKLWKHAGRGFFPPQRADCMRKGVLSKERVTANEGGLRGRLGGAADTEMALVGLMNMVFACVPQSVDLLFRGHVMPVFVVFCLKCV